MSSRIAGEHAVRAKVWKWRGSYRGRAAALDRGDGAAAASQTPVARALERAEEGADEDGKHGAAELVVEGHEVAKPVRDGEDPLAHGKPSQDIIDEMGGALVHAPAGAGGAPAAPLAGERHESLEPTAVAAEPREPASGMTAGDELSELALDEAGNAGACTLADFVEEVLELGAHDLVQDAVLWRAGPVGGRTRRLSECARRCHDSARSAPRARTRTRSRSGNPQRICEGVADRRCRSNAGVKRDDSRAQRTDQPVRTSSSAD